MHYLIVPGYSNSGPTHWQTYWTKSLPDASRVYQHSWDQPLKADWVLTLDETVSGLKTDTILYPSGISIKHYIIMITSIYPHMLPCIATS